MTLTELRTEYAKADNEKARVRVSREIRLQEATILRMLSRISTEAPKAETLTSVKARRAANARGAKDAN